MNASTWLLAVTAFSCAPGAQRAEGPDDVRARMAMVDEQVASRGVRDPSTLAALRKVPRHLFVPLASQREAYDDHPLPIGHGQTISQPYIVGFMTEALGLKGGETVLEVGTGSGYQAAVLSETAGKVYTIEIVPALAEEARGRLLRLGYANVEVPAGDEYQELIVVTRRGASFEERRVLPVRFVPMTGKVRQ